MVRVQWSAADGERVTRRQTFGSLQGSALSILTNERVALNFLQRMSGIATATACMVDAAKVRPPRPRRQQFLLQCHFLQRRV